MAEEAAAAAPAEEQAPEEPAAPDFSEWMPEGGEPLADGEYDVIVMGTGLTECMMSGLLSVLGMKVLHIDRNNYYGADSASVNLTNLWQKFRNEDPSEAAFAALGNNRDWNIDLIPKFLMACGDLVKILLHTKVTRYLEFKSCAGSYVLKSGRVLKVPATPQEALSSSLMGMFEKRRFRKFLIWLDQYDEADPATYQGVDVHRMTMRQVFEKYGLDDNTMSFIGHAMALRRDDSYLDQAALETVKAIQLYTYSLQRYGQSPFIYPMFGLGGLPEGFSRLCAINGGTFMLDRPVDEILFDEDGVAWGIRCTDNEGDAPVQRYARATMLIGDPSYFPAEKSRSTAQVVRSICILDHPVPSTDDGDSCQIILPAAQVGRTNDIYVMSTSSAHCVASQGKTIAIVSTTVETSDPIAELNPGLALLGPILDRFDSVSEVMAPLDDGTADRCFISKSYDATSHFQSTALDVLDLYERVTGTQLDMNINADSVEEQY